jgi:methylthioribose-1-phosphate isomerase
MGPPLEAIKWVHGPDRTSLALLDQRLLPHTMEYIDIPGADAGWTAIKVRGDAKGEGGGGH